MKRVIIADDHPIFRQGLVAALREAPDFAIVGEAENGEEALALLDRLHPDIAVADINMPVMDGLALLRTARARSIECDFVVLTMFTDQEYFKDAMDLGAKGYLLKDGAAGDLLRCLRAVAAGRHYVSPALSDVLLSRSLPRAPLGRTAASLEALSPTERRILRLIAENRTSREIGEELNISHHTVNNHRAHICQKLGLEGPHSLLPFALEHRARL